MHERILKHENELFKPYKQGGFRIKAVTVILRDRDV